MNKFEKRYNMEEKHRGKWQPLMIEGDEEKQKQVILEERFADALNVHAERRKIRYVLAEEKKATKKVDVETPLAKAKRIKEEISVNRITWYLKLIELNNIMLSSIF